MLVALQGERERERGRTRLEKCITTVTSNAGNQQSGLNRTIAKANDCNRNNNYNNNNMLAHYASMLHVGQLAFGIRMGVAFRRHCSIPAVAG